MTTNKNTARVKSYDARLKESGGRVIHKLRLKPAAALALEKLELGGESPTVIINRLLETEAAK